MFRHYKRYLNEYNINFLHSQLHSEILYTNHFNYVHMNFEM